MGWVVRAIVAAAYANVCVVAGMAVGANEFASGRSRRDFYALGMQEAADAAVPKIVYQVSFAVGDFGYGLGYWMADTLGVVSVQVVGYASTFSMIAVSVWVLMRALPSITAVAR